MALSTRMSKMTNGSTYAAKPSSPSPKRAMIKEMVAANSKILANKSSNCSLILSHNEVSSSSSSSFVPYCAILFLNSADDNPVYRSVLSCLTTSLVDILWNLKSAMDPNFFNASDVALILFSSPFYIFVFRIKKILNYDTIFQNLNIKS
jgi:hypothetical protein